MRDRRESESSRCVRRQLHEDGYADTSQIRLRGLVAWGEVFFEIGEDDETFGSIATSTAESERCESDGAAGMGLITDSSRG